LRRSLRQVPRPHLVLLNCGFRELLCDEVLKIESIKVLEVSGQLLVLKDQESNVRVKFFLVLQFLSDLSLELRDEISIVVSFRVLRSTTPNRAARTNTLLSNGVISLIYHVSILKIVFSDLELLALVIETVVVANDTCFDEVRLAYHSI
jgi:hypothetical protein